MRFLDFQATRLHSPVIDLSQFFYLSSPKHVMDEVDKYLKVYYSSFSEFLRELGSDSDFVFPFDIFLKYWGRFSKFGMAMALFCLRFSIAEEGEIPQLLTTEGLDETVNSGMSNQKEQDKRVIDVVRHFVERPRV